MPFHPSPLALRGHFSRQGLLAVAALILALAGCATPHETKSNARLNQTINASAWAQNSLLPSTDAERSWSHHTVGTRPTSSYTPRVHAGRPALEARSHNGDSLVRRPLALEGPKMGSLQFSWFVNELNSETDLADTEFDDAVVRVILHFGGDRTKFSARDHMLSELMHALTGDPLPYATLMYVWDHQYPIGTVLSHARSKRIKMMVVESGPAQLGRWVDIDRDIAADYRLAFGKEPQSLKGMALMTDSNNTKQPAKAWYGPLLWRPSPPM